MVCFVHHLMQDFDTLFVSDLIEGFFVERNVVGCVEGKVIVVHVVGAVVVSSGIVCV